MRTEVPEAILSIIDDLDTQQSVPLTRLTVLQEWFERPGRLSAFGLWVARRAAGRKGKTTGRAGALLDEARASLGSAASAKSLFQQLDRAAAQRLYDRAQEFQPEPPLQPGGPARIIHCRALLLVEKGLALHLGLTATPAEGYQLAADWAQHSAPAHGNALQGPSRGKLEELMRFMFTVEALEGTP